MTCEWSLSATAEHSPDASANTTSVYLQFTVPGNDPPTFTIAEGNVTRFPDEGPVQYTLNITRQDEIGDGRLVVTPTTADACRIIYPAQPPTYQNRTAIAIYGVVYAGAANATGDLPGGTCVVNFVVAEDGEEAPAQQRSVTFNTELAPSITAQVTGNRVNVPTDHIVNISVTATKLDNSNTLAVIFLGRVISSAGCTATLAGNELRQYNGILAGSSSVPVTYMVTSAIIGGACGNFAFTATEGAATAANNFVSGIIFVDADPDGDGFADSLDVDDDGDGLIEIATADELNQLRDDLAGSSLAGNRSGCGGSRAGNALECNGYELVADIDLAADGYNNWDPIGRGLIGKDPSFTGIFEGNNHIIDNLNMQLDGGRNLGLFGSIKGATLRNVHVRNINITYSGDNAGIVDGNFVVPNRVGGLAGEALIGSMIINSSVTGHLVAGARNVGGLAGYAIGLGIISSYVELEEVNATSRDAGGLVGFSAAGVTVRLSYALTDKVAVVGRNGGGLFGYAFSTRIESSMSITTNITTQNLGLSRFAESAYGGLLGEGRSAALSFTAGITGNMLGNVSTSGGLLGFARNSPETTIDASYAITQFQTVRPGNNRHGGLVGADNGKSIIGDSYWDSTVLSPVDRRNFPAVTHGQGNSTTALQGTTDFSGSNIYAAWGNGWCDVATNEFITDASHPLATIPNADANRFWDLGGANEYPAMNCLPNNFTPAKQRAAMARVLNGESPLRN